MKQAIVVASVVLASAFYVGKLSLNGTREFAHADVVDAADACAPGTFIGGCKTCQTCSNFEYAAGGCSYFKDTFCTLCEPIANCPQKEIRCTTNSDETCLNCNVGYYGDDCKPCEVCDPGFYETGKCTQDSDTVCTECTAGGANEFLSAACSYEQDATWTVCKTCPVGKFTEETCQTSTRFLGDLGYLADARQAYAMATSFPGADDAALAKAQAALEAVEAKAHAASVYTVQQDTICTDCKDCGEDMYVSATCTTSEDTTCAACGKCHGQDSTGFCVDRTDCKYEIETCNPGSVLGGIGDTPQCADCTKRKNTEWEVFKCGDASDGLFATCSQCQEGEYMQQECTETSDTVCPVCSVVVEHELDVMAIVRNVAYPGTSVYSLENCKGHGSQSGLRCTDGEHTTCEECEENWFGATCAYHKYTGECGTLTTRERASNRGGFHGDTDEQFIQFCLELCDEFPDCMAFELEDGGTNLAASGPNSFMGNTATCYFKAAYTMELCDRKELNCDSILKTRYRSKSPGKDCYSNVVRQNKGMNTYFPELSPFDPCTGKADGDECTRCEHGDVACLDFCLTSDTGACSCQSNPDTGNRPLCVATPSP